VGAPLLRSDASAGGDVRPLNPIRIMRAFRCRRGFPPPRVNGKQVRGFAAMPVLPPQR